MLATLLFLMIRRYRRQHPQKWKLIISKALFVFKILLFLLLGCTGMIVARGQETNLTYSVTRNGSEIGTISIKEIKKGTQVFYYLQSQIKVQFILHFTVKAIEEAVYENGVLVSSFIYRKFNGSEKTNKRIRSAGKNYIIQNKGSEELLNSYPIRYNMVCVYTQEPVNVTQLFSDNFQRFIPIKKTAPHHYKIVFPDGNTNEYFYQNGVCIRIKMTTSLYNAEIEIKG